MHEQSQDRIGLRFYSPKKMIIDTDLGNSLLEISCNYVVSANIYSSLVWKICINVRLGLDVQNS